MAFQMPSRRSREEAPHHRGGILAGKVSRQPPRNYLARREQRRLFLYVGLLMAMVILIDMAARPNSWRWFEVLAGAPIDQPAKSVVKEEVDPEYQPPRPRRLGMGEFIVAPDSPTQTNSDVPPPEAAPAEDEPPTTDEAPPLEPAMEFADDSARLPGISDELLASVTDNQPILRGERDAWGVIFKRLGEADPHEISQTAGPPDLLPQVFVEPGRLRGHILRFGGTLEKLTKIELPEDAGEPRRFWQAVVLVRHGETPFPVIVSSLDVAPELRALADSKTSRKGREEGDPPPVEVVGVFFKICSYKARSADGPAMTLRLAPIVLSRTITPTSAESLASLSPAASATDQTQPPAAKPDFDEDAAEFAAQVRQAKIESYRNDPALAPGVDPELLVDVRDRVPFNAEEAEAWYQILKMLEESPPGAFKKHSVGEITFAQLLSQPEVYRGKAISIVGKAREATRIDPPENDAGISVLYKIGIQPSRGQNEPIIAYVTELPEGFPLGGRIFEDVEFEAISYRVYPYVAPGKEGIGVSRTAPLVLAKTLRWTPRKTAVMPLPSAWVAAGAIAATMLAAAAVAFAVHRANRAASRGVEMMTRRSGGGSLDEAVPADQVETVDQRLERMSRQS